MIVTTKSGSTYRFTNLEHMKDWEPKFYTCKLERSGLKLRWLDHQLPNTEELTELDATICLGITVGAGMIVECPIGIPEMRNFRTSAVMSIIVEDDDPQDIIAEIFVDNWEKALDTH